MKDANPYLAAIDNLSENIEEVFNTSNKTVKEVLDHLQQARQGIEVLMTIL